MKTSLIISTYKSPKFLNMVLESVQNQKLKPLEIIVTEDGQFADNEALIKKWQNISHVPLFHLKQNDHGNRKPLALNKAILKSQGDYLIFLDGDCVIRNDFIADHLNLAEGGHFLAGRRVELSEKATKVVFSKKNGSKYLGNFPVRLLYDSVFGETHHFGRFFRTPALIKKMVKRNKVHDIRGCNFSVRREDLFAINGFDNTFSGAYGEDSDVEYRLKFHGLKMKSLRGAAIQYHLWHPTQTKDLSNQVRLIQVLKNKTVRSSSGLDQAENIS